LTVLVVIIGVAAVLLIGDILGGNEEKPATSRPRADLANTTTVAADTCFNNVNLLFAMDGSNSVEPRNYQQQKDFVKSIVDQLAVDRFSVAMIQWATRARTEFPLEKGRTTEEIKSLIDKVKKIKGTTYTSEAIAAANKIFKGATYENKDKDQNILILMTDGKEVWPDYLRNSLNRYKREAVVTTTTYAVGVDKAWLQELRQIASDNNKAFYSRTFDGLPNFVDELAEASNSIGCADS